MYVVHILLRTRVHTTHYECIIVYVILTNNMT